MGAFQPRTDLAMEAREILREQDAAELPGVEYKEEEISGVKCQIMEITAAEAANRLGKPVGVYCTVEIEPVMRRDQDGFQRGAEAISEMIRRMLPQSLGEAGTLVAGLGNRAITPDAVGPLAVESTLVTRHLKEMMPQDFAGFSNVAAITPGVLGTTGIESSEYVKSICGSASPSLVVAVDALAARSLSRLCRTVQITDTGITPGSGVGNSRSALNKSALGVPVIAVGVPTVVDVSTLVADMGGTVSQEGDAAENEMIVTPRTIDADVNCVSRLVGYSLNLALHNGLTISDIDMLLG